METHLIRSAHAKPFISELEKHKVDVHSLVRQVGLPIEILSNDAVIGEFALWRLVDQAATLVKNPLFGYKCAESSPVIELASIGINADESFDLLTIMRKFIARAQLESTSCYYSLIPSGDNNTKLQRLPAFGSKFSSWQVEQYMLSVFIQIIRLCAPIDWLPANVSVSSSDKPQHIPDEWHSIDFEWGAEATQITIGNQLLILPPHKNISPTAIPEESNSLSFSQLIASHVRIQRTNLNQLSTELGVSTSTLKRRLSSQGDSFNEMVLREKHAWACELLSMTMLPISHISTKLGYNHISNFTRAFKKLSGESPASYRKQNRN